MKDPLGDRMKAYENVPRSRLTRRTPVIIRVDGRAFHTLTRSMEKPYDTHFMETMQATAEMLCRELHGAKLAYVQSDEISILLTDYDKLTTEPCFGNNLQKLVSISASIATDAFNFVASRAFDRWLHAQFDSRAFNIPKEEVCNYFLWRQNDATRNAVQLLGQAYFSAKQLDGVGVKQLQDKLFTEKGINFNDQRTDFRRGACIVRKPITPTLQLPIFEQGQFGVSTACSIAAACSAPGQVWGPWQVDREIPVFSQDRAYIDKWVYVDEPPSHLVTYWNSKDEVSTGRSQVNP